MHQTACWVSLRSASLSFLWENTNQFIQRAVRVPVFPHSFHACLCAHHCYLLHTDHELSPSGLRGLRRRIERDGSQSVGLEGETTNVQEALYVSWWTEGDTV